MKNGLYFVPIHMRDGVKGRDSGVLFLHDGELIGGGPYFWSVGSYTVDHGTWKGDLRTNQHTPFADPFIRPLFGGQEVTSGFSGTFADDRAEVFGTTLVGNRSLSFRATLKKLADDLCAGGCNLVRPAPVMSERPHNPHARDHRDEPAENRGSAIIRGYRRHDL